MWAKQPLRAPESEQGAPFQHRRRQWTATWTVVSVLAAASVSGIVAVAALWAEASGWLAATALSYAAWVLLLRRMRGCPFPRRTILACALAARAVWLPVPLVLSDDAYRYVWDGLVVLDGGNPYAETPSGNLLLQHEHPWLFTRLNSATYHSVYPTVSQAAFVPMALAYRAAGGGAGGWPWAEVVAKLLFGGAELLTLTLLARRLSRRHLALYALCPLVVVDGFGQPHTESLVLLALVAAALVPRHRVPTRAALVGLAGWVKLWPFLLMPVVIWPLIRRLADEWMRRTPTPGPDAAPLALNLSESFVARAPEPPNILRALLATVAVGACLVLLALPFAAPGALAGFRASLDLYVRLFEFNAGPYYAIKELGRWWTGGDISKSLGPAMRGAFAVGATLVLVRALWKRWPLAKVGAAISGVFLVTTTTVHPWYLVPLAGLIAAASVEGGRDVSSPLLRVWLRPAPWFALGAGAMASYAIYRGAPAALVVAAGWGAWAVLMLRPLVPGRLAAVMRMRARQKLARMAPALTDLGPLVGLRVLDLGCGEGFVGAELARRGADVTLADVAGAEVSRDVGLPFVALPDAGLLPFATGAFDVIVLVYVLHHAADADALLAEACRVGRHVVVLESVFETAREERILRRLDVLANRLRGGWMTPQEEHLTFRTADAWRAAVQKVSSKDVQMQHLGRPPHRQALLWF